MMHMARMSAVLMFVLATSASAHYEVIGGDVVHGQFGLTNINLDVPKHDVVDQTRKLANRVFIKTALRAALNSFLDDASHAESPLALCFDEAFEKVGVKPSYPVPSNVVSAAKEILWGYLDRRTTKLRILHLSEKPEGGESVEEAWIFELRIGDLSDHTQWAVVDRQGKLPTYNYGFN